eukprot:15358530-Ditylum_brightwellii.AAC.1
MHQHKPASSVAQQRAACGGCMDEEGSRGQVSHPGKTRHNWSHGCQQAFQEVDNHVLTKD